MKTPFNRDWSEFDWEREIREDEARINRYMDELHEFIDLPDEEQIIMKRMQKSPELIPQKEHMDGFPFDPDDFDEDLFFGDDWKKQKGADVYIQLEKLAWQWNIIFASKLKKRNMKTGIRITCMYGKLIARISDVMDLARENFPALVRAICKRLAADINGLLGELEELAAGQGDIKIKIEAQKSQLLRLREKIIDLYEEKG